LNTRKRDFKAYEGPPILIVWWCQNPSNVTSKFSLLWQAEVVSGSKRESTPPNATSRSFSTEILINAGTLVDHRIGISTHESRQEISYHPWSLHDANSHVCKVGPVHHTDSSAALPSQEVLLLQESFLINLGPLYVTIILHAHGLLLINLYMCTWMFPTFLAQNGWSPLYLLLTNPVD